MTSINLSPPRSRRRRRLLGVTATVAVSFVALAPASASAQPASRSKPTVVLVHGAWADASGWNAEVRQLQRDGYPVVALANPLRSLSGDAASVSAFLDTIPGPVILVGHSYGGAVITNAANGHSNVRALVYIDAFAPDEGEPVTPLAGEDSALSVADPSTVFNFVPATQPLTPATDVYLKTSVFVTSFANGLSAAEKQMLAAAQRPITVQALFEPSGVPAWRTIRSWSLIGTQDHIITPAAELAMDQRAGATVSYFNAGHLGLISDPGSVTREIERAAKATAP